MVCVAGNCWTCRIVASVCKSDHVRLAMLTVGCGSSHGYRVSIDQYDQSACYSTTSSRPSLCASSSANFQSIFNASLQAYDNKTKNKLLDHPLSTQLQSCDSLHAILTVLQDLVKQFDQRRTSEDRLNNWLDPTVNVLYAFSDALGEGIGLVSLSSLSL